MDRIVLPRQSKPFDQFARRVDLAKTDGMDHHRRRRPRPLIDMPHASCHGAADLLPCLPSAQPERGGDAHAQTVKDVNQIDRVGLREARYSPRSAM